MYYFCRITRQYLEQKTVKESMYQKHGGEQDEDASRTPASVDWTVDYRSDLVYFVLGGAW